MTAGLIDQANEAARVAMSVLSSQDLVETCLALDTKYNLHTSGISSITSCRIGEAKSGEDQQARISVRTESFINHSQQP